MISLILPILFVSIYLYETLVGKLLYYINMDTQETIKINSPEISIKDLQHTQEFLYIYDENQVSKFKLTF